MNMKDYIEMRWKKSGEIVRVYDMFPSHEGCWCTVWRPSQKYFETVKIKNLIPIDYVLKDGVVSPIKE